MKGISRIVGEALCQGGARRPLYEALRRLLCSSCGAFIAEGARFTRHGPAGGRGPILPRCASCVPFEEPGARRSSLLEALLSPDEHRKPEGTADTRTVEAVENRLGPALARSRKSRAGD